MPEELCVPYRFYVARLEGDGCGDGALDPQARQAVFLFLRAVCLMRPVAATVPKPAYARREIKAGKGRGNNPCKGATVPGALT